MPVFPLETLQGWKLHVRMKEENQFSASVEEMTELLLFKLSSVDN